MVLRDINQFRTSSKSFNMTPIVDIVFLMIIFFLVVFQFIDAENFPVNVPDNCDYALDGQQQSQALTTVTVLKSQNQVDFAVGAKKISPLDTDDIAEKLTDLINIQLKNIPPGQRTVILRIDKDICFSDAQYALAGISQSIATDIQLATFKNTQPEK